MKKILTTQLSLGLMLILSVIAVIVFFSAYSFIQHFIQQKDVPLVEKEATFNPETTLETLNTTDDIDDFLQLQTMIQETLKKFGTKAGFAVIDAGEKKGIISNDACHELLHYVGHAAYAEHPGDFDALLNVVEGTHCMGGYVHGIEAEIVAESSNMVEDVQNFCKFQKEKGINPGPCYHGVGHAAAELYHYDIPKSLATCDALIGGPESDMSNCYRGIFSQVGNIVTGFDGHTGLKVDPITIDKLDPQNPFAYCETFDQNYQSSCKSQLMKVATMNLEMDNWLQACKTPGLSVTTVNICVNIVSGVYTRSQLSFKQTTQLPKDINTFTEDQQQIAVLGASEAFSGYFSDNSQKDWESFCQSFDNKKTASYCVKVFTDIKENNSAPWMERTDIR